MGTAHHRAHTAVGSEAFVSECGLNVTKALALPEEGTREIVRKEQQRRTSTLSKPLDRIRSRCPGPTRSHTKPAAKLKAVVAGLGDQVLQKFDASHGGRSRSRIVTFTRQRATRIGTVSVARREPRGSAARHDRAGSSGATIASVDHVKANVGWLSRRLCRSSKKLPVGAACLLWACLAVGKCCLAQDPHTYPLNLEPDVRDAFEHFYNLDYDGAGQRFEAVLKAHPLDPMANAYVLMVVEFRELYRDDLLDTTYYARENFLASGRKVVIDPAVRKRIEDLTDGAVRLADAQLQKDSRDKNAYFARGYAKGLHAAFITLAEHSYVGAARQGLASRNDSEQVLKIDPDYVDAQMAIGIQQFAVASLPRGIRMLVGIAGIGGNKEHGLALLRECVEHGTLTKVESQTALSLFLRHDRRYNEAYDVAHKLSLQFPHN